MYVQCDPLWRGIKTHVVAYKFLKSWRKEEKNLRNMPAKDAKIITYNNPNDCHVTCQDYNLFLNEAYKIYKPLEEIISRFFHIIRHIASDHYEEWPNLIQNMINRFENDWKIMNKEREDSGLSFVITKHWKKSKLFRVILGLIRREKVRLKMIHTLKKCNLFNPDGWI